MSGANDFVIEQGVLTRYTGPGGDAVIPEGVTRGGKGAFENCAGLGSVVIPGSVTAIGDSAFMGSSLRSVVLPQGVTRIGENAFDEGTVLV